MIDRAYTKLKNHPQIGQRPVVRQFVKFSLVGVINTITSATVYFFSRSWLELTPLLANALAFAVAVTVSYTLNRRWTFRNRDPKYAWQYSRFLTVTLIGFGWSELIIWFLHHRLGYHDAIAFAVSVGIVMFWNFSLNRLWTFRGSA